MMYRKALLFSDHEVANQILKTKDPETQKKLGKAVKNFNQKIWDENNIQIVTEGNYLKFSQNSHLKKQLLATGDKILVEGSPKDIIWGVGLHYNDSLILDHKNWRGQNLLGIALMKARDLLKKDSNV